ncbi:zinc finger protein 488 [Sphaerodactylus townsendi]|uniref:zinc finger protein 488 n=1 Tax=Sphaerodactylus townsendi TaxID=933632 RepID=UPI0020272B9C|nr:zinc finger protein 488 [Sphaerodactylus townsendi]XP_048362197.1 zinc finger protein 488 [Sphaerodactylus townsendi]
MELPLLPKGFWASDSKLLHYPFPDALVTVHTTQEIAKEIVLGPCLLQDTKLDTVAFIALKCLERRNIHYIVKVDVAAVPSPGGFPWMRLVQAAANKKQQNLEATLNNGRLYYRPTRTIFRNEELLVWYDEELSGLLGFREIQASSQFQSELSCPSCKQEFRWEYTYLSHARFFCGPEKGAQLWRSLWAPKTVKRRSAEQPTNFHSLARDLEVKMAPWKDDASHAAVQRKANGNETESNQSRKPVLLEKTNCLHREHHGGSREGSVRQQTPAGALWKFVAGKPVFLKKDTQGEDSAFTEVRQTKGKEKAEEAHEAQQRAGAGHSGKEQNPSHLVPSPPGSAFSLVWPTRVAGEPKSAFRKPAKRLLDRKAVAAPQDESNLGKGLGKLSGYISATDVMRYGSFLTSKVFVGDLSSSPLLQSSPFSCPSGLWPRLPGGQILTVPTSGCHSASLALLPPTFTSFGVAAQNWCAKCNLSFPR